MTALRPALVTIGLVAAIWLALAALLGPGHPTDEASPGTHAAAPSDGAPAANGGARGDSTAQGTSPSDPSAATSETAPASAPAALAVETGPPPRFGLPHRALWLTSQVRGSPEPQPPFRTVRAFPHILLDKPTLLLLTPDGKRWIGGEQRGNLVSFRNDPEVRELDPLLDLRTDLTTYEAGSTPIKLDAVYGFAFHPKFAENRFCYVCYATSPKAGRAQQEDGTRVSRFRMTETDPPRLDPASEEIVITWLGGGHNGGCLEFGPDGCLYISTGDGSFPNPPDARLAGQDVSNLLSSILRIDVDHTDPDKKYAIPKDNPFVELPGARGEIWCYGFRNPWKMTFDRETGDLWVGDVGWEQFEMVQRVTKGGNYGWSIMEGTQPVRTELKPGPTPILPPTIELPHSLAASVTGGYVYRGRAFPELVGRYVFGDWETRRMWAAQWDGQKVVAMPELVEPTLRIVTYAEDAERELLVVDYDDGTIHRFERNPDRDRPPSFPVRLSQTGLFASVPDHVPAAGVVPFSINSPLWSDGAEAERFVALPLDSSIKVFDKDQPIPGTIFHRTLEFPAGTVLMKTLSIRPVFEDPEIRHRIETQLLHYDGRRWAAYAYRWNDAQDDAELVPAEGLELELTIRDPEAPGGSRTRPWHISGRAECARCHNPWARHALAFSLPQLDRPHDYGGFVDHQLRALAHVGILEGLAKPDGRGDIDGKKLADRIANLVDPYAPHESVDRRARSYLHANCAHCHQMGAGGTADIELRFDQPLEKTKLVGQRPLQGTFEIPEASLVVPGDPYRSILYYRMSKVGRGRMPHVGSEVVDVPGLALIHDWIRQLPIRLDDQAVVKQLAALDEDAAREAECTAQEGRRATLAKKLAKDDGRKAPSDDDHRQAAESDRLQIAERAKQRDSQRKQLLAKLLTDGARALVLADALRRDELPRAVREFVVTEATARPEPQIRDVFEEFLPPERRTKRLGTVIRPAELLALAGDVQRGRALFHSTAGITCRNCHRIGTDGKQLGPDLGTIGKKLDRAALLESILEPSKRIDPQFQTWLVETVQGKVHSGLLASRTDDLVVLKDARGEEIRIAARDVEQLLPQRQSLMPELLLRDMTAPQVADLLAYLASLK